MHSGNRGATHEVLSRSFTFRDIKEELMFHARRFTYSFGLTGILIIFEFLIFALVFGGCGYYDEHEMQKIGKEASSMQALPCMVTTVYAPVNSEDLQNVYQGRSFYADVNHLGHDVSLPEGSSISPVGCGKLQVYRPSSGYGQLVVVIEHEFPFPVQLTNGEGKQVKITRFLSIYGHLRKSEDRMGGNASSFSPGDRIDPVDTIGYIDQDATNGDGAEHVHIGIRLQSASDAVKTDPSAWFRGYDKVPSQRKWYADPLTFLNEAHTALGGPSCYGTGGSGGSSSESGSSSSSSSGSGTMSSSSSSSGSSGGSSTGVPVGMIQFVYTGPAMSGSHELHGMWDPPGPSSVSWGSEATVQCPDVVPGDGGLECLLAMSSGTQYFTFTVRLPDGSWWGDMSNDPKGGKGKPIGNVTLTGPNGEISYQMVNNGSGPEYYNGFVSVIP
ncbi:MAG: hypothetical protein NUV81_02775 [bacterium]|nr:hypothetical protein [bacterium]